MIVLPKDKKFWLFVSTYNHERIIVSFQFIENGRYAINNGPFSFDEEFIHRVIEHGAQFFDEYQDWFHLYNYE